MIAIILSVTMVIVIVVVVTDHFLQSPFQCFDKCTWLLLSRPCLAGAMLSLSKTHPGSMLPLSKTHPGSILVSAAYAQRLIMAGHLKAGVHQKPMRGMCPW